MPQRQHDDSLAWFPEDLENVDFKDLACENGKLDGFAKKLGSRLKTTQLRKFFDEIKKIERNPENIDNDLALLVPKLKFAEARGLSPKAFTNLISRMAKEVTTESDKDKKIRKFKNSVKLLEAIVAYHKYHYPKGG